jgi:hypothetical protein
MTPWPFIAVILVITFIAMLVIRLRFLPKPIKDDQEAGSIEKTPMTQLQKRAWIGLGIGVIVSAALTYLFLTYGIMTVMETDRLRHIYTGFWIGGLLLYVLIVFGHLVRSELGRSVVDERDLRILSRAPVVQRIAVLLTLVVWSIALTESFRDPGAVPTDFLYVIVASAFIVDLMAFSVGILLGYWWMERYGQS